MAQQLPHYSLIPIKLRKMYDIVEIKATKST